MSILAPNSHVLYREVYQQHQQLQHQNWSSGCCLYSIRTYGFGLERRKSDEWRKIVKRDCKVEAFGDFARPSFVEMVPITDVEQFDQILEKAKHDSHPIIIDWMAAWCRKCIYLKPKLEKLAAEYDTKFKFYCVDVNNVPQALVKRGNISLWKDGEMKAEVIGGHKAWLVVDEVRDMIKRFL